jgi:hypothetical protein
MMAVRRCVALSAMACALAPCASPAAEPDAPLETSFSLTGSYYAMRDEPDFGVYVAALQRGPLRFEARHNYEAKSATSAFAGYAWSGGEDIAWSITPMLGGLFGSTRGVVPAVEASVVWRKFDLYVEAEYVHDLDDSSASYFYAWTEIGWRPVEPIRIGLVGQRTRIVSNDRDLQAGVFGQLTLGKATIGVYAFNPESASRYVVLSLGLAF